MDLLTTLGVLARRWYLTVPALVLTVAATLAAGWAVPPAYQATGAVVLLSPDALPAQAGRGTVAVNPYLEFGPSLRVTADVLAKAIMSDAATARTRAAGATANYEVAADTAGSSPIINIVATGGSPEQATSTARVVADGLAAELARRQAAVGVASASWIRMATLSTPRSARRLLGSRLRAQAAVAVIGAALTVGTAFLTEGIVESWRRRARRGAATPPPGQREPAMPHARARRHRRTA